MKYLAVLGRQPLISLAELESLFKKVQPIAPNLATFESSKKPDINRLGGSLKLAGFLETTPLDFLQNQPEGKITLGLSDYSPRATARATGAEALKLKKILVRHNRSVRVVPNANAVLSTATSHNNHLGEKPGKVELIKFGKNYFVSIGTQNITAYAKRDQARPARDAKVGMLPPKLAQILINLCGDLSQNSRLLDPFCGTGVVLQEAWLMGYRPYGTDLSERMVEYSKKNLKWLAARPSSVPSDETPLDSPRSSKDIPSSGALKAARPSPTPSDGISLDVGDATNFTWASPVDAVACEGYLGQPMSQPPAEIKLKEQKHLCKEIILGFLKNFAKQAQKGTPVTMAIPAWLRPNGNYSRLNILDEVEKLGYNVLKFKNLSQKDLLYYREGQIVAREIIVLRKK